MWHVFPIVQMAAKVRVLIPFDGGFAQVEAKRPEVGERCAAVAMKDGEPYIIPLRPIAEGDTTIVITAADGTEVPLKCEKILYVAAQPGKLQQ